MTRPIPPWFEDVASALVYSVASNYSPEDQPELQPPYNDLTQFVVHQYAHMPDYLRLPLRGLTWCFDVLGFSGGHRFKGSPPEARRKQIARWKTSPLAFQRDLIRYFESLTVLALHDRASLTSLRDPRGKAPSGNETASERELKCEIAVIGSGPGGAITACLLAEAGRNVTLIEEGEHHSLESCRAFSVREMLQKYRNGGQTVALGKNKIAYVEGCCVGGGSEINSGLYHRTPPEILESWRKDFQVENLREEDLRPHFEACERDLSVSLTRGAVPAASLRLHEGAKGLGWKSLEVPRWVKNETTGVGQRQSMTQTYVPRFLAAGGTLLSQTRAQRIYQEGRGWKTDCEHRTRGGLEVRSQILFVCGGAVQTPALLRRSGISENIGNSLHVHPTIKLAARFAEEVNPENMEVPMHQVKEFAPRISLGCSVSSPSYLALGLLDFQKEAGSIRETSRYFANYYAMITGEGRGTVRPLPRFRDALVRYALTEKDRRDLADGLSKLCEAIFEGGAVAIYPGTRCAPALLSRDDVAKLPRIVETGSGSLMTIHLFSSCPMGEDRNKCAADSFGRVHGLNNLRISDASLLCTAPGVNPQGSIMAVARRNAVHFLAQ